MSPALQGHAAMAAFAALIAGSFSLGAQAAPHIDPAALNAARFAAAAGIIGAAAALGARGLRREDFRAPWRYLALGGLLAVYFVLMFVALQSAPAVAVAAVFTLIPALAALFGFLVLGQRTRPAAGAALALGAAGALWVIFRGDLGRLMALEIGRGEALFVVGVAAYALYAPLVRRLNRGEPALPFTFGTLLAGALALSVWAAPALAATDWGGLPAVVWVCLAYLAVATTAVTFFLLQLAAMRLPAGKVMAYGYLVPSFVALYEGLAGRGWPATPVWLGVAATVGALAALVALRD